MIAAAQHDGNIGSWLFFFSYSMESFQFQMQFNFNFNSKMNASVLWDLFSVCLCLVNVLKFVIFVACVIFGQKQPPHSYIQASVFMVDFMPGIWWNLKWCFNVIINALLPTIYECCCLWSNAYDYDELMHNHKMRIAITHKCGKVILRKIEIARAFVRALA